MVIGLENEHACNVGTGAEAGAIAAATRSSGAESRLGSGERFHPRRDAVSRTATHRFPPIASCTSTPRTASSAIRNPSGAPLGEMGIDWKGQIAALERDGYRGWISLETHWTGPSGDKFEASTICGRNLKSLVVSRR